MGSNPNHSNNIPLFIVLLFATSSCTSAYNITYFLSNHPDFSNFNDLLTRTGLDMTINNLQSTITVLALDNSAIGSLSGQSQSSQRAMLATHVLLDYFDSNKLKGMKTTPHTATNLYQKIGKSNGKQGSTNIVKNGNDIIFYSAVDNSQKDSKLVKEVGSKPFDIIILQINTPIIVPGLDKGGAEAPESQSSKSSSIAAPTPSDDSSSPSPNLSPEDAPAADEKTDKSTSKNGGARVMANVGGLVLGALALAA